MWSAYFKRQKGVNLMYRWKLKDLNWDEGCVWQIFVLILLQMAENVRLKAELSPYTEKYYH